MSVFSSHSALHVCPKWHSSVDTSVISSWDKQNYTPMQQSP